MHILLRSLPYVALLLLVGGCAFAQDTLRLLEPVIDQAAQFGANSAGEAVKEAMGSRWGGGEIAGVTTGAVMSIYGALKAWGWARKSKPPEA